jgi:hypothetical protein
MKRNWWLICGILGGMVVTVLFVLFIFSKGIPDFVKGSELQLSLFITMAAFTFFSFALA